MTATISDDLLLHEGADAGFAERWYFNVQRPDGELVAIVGGALYRNRGVVECYACALEDGRQVNVRAHVPIAEGSVTSAAVTAGPFRFACEEPMRRWRIAVASEPISLAATFTSATAPYDFPAIEIPADPGSPDFDSWRHFTGPGRIDVSYGEDGGRERALSFRDRTWGVRSRRPRMHNWYVFHLGPRFLTLVHQERADGSVLYSRAALTESDGSVLPLRIAEHRLEYESGSRVIRSGRIALEGIDARATLEFERVGEPLRLAGAGYDAQQGQRAGSGMAGESWDLGDAELIARIGRGTMDAPARGILSFAGETAEAVGVVETAIARDHHRYGSRL